MPSDPQPDPAVVLPLADFGKTIAAQLAPDAKNPPGGVQVISTFNCVTETVWFPTGPWVLFDTALKDANADLNTLALTQSPPHDALRWGFKTLARFLAVEGDWHLACAALIAGAGSPDGEVDPGSANAKPAEACAAVQDYFTLAHEFVHLALSEGRLAEAAAAHDADVTAALAGSEPTPETLAAARSLITYDVAEILGRSGGVSPANIAPLKALAGEPGSAPGSLETDFRRNRPAQLKEELLCVPLATDLVVGAFRDIFDEPLLLLAMYLGFRNLQCVENVRALAETVAAANRGRSTDEAGHARAMWNAAWRLSAWRNWLPTSLLQTPGAEIWDMLGQASRRYDRSIGNEILFALPSRLTRCLTELHDSGPLPLTSDLVALMVLGDCETETLAKIIERSGFNKDHSSTQLSGALHQQYQPRQHAVQMGMVRRWLGLAGANRNDEPTPSGAYAGGRATVQDLARMFDDGVFLGASHMIVVCDAFDDTDFPEYVMPGQDVHRVEAEVAQKPFQRVMEVYNLREDKRGQMRSGSRVFRY